MDALLDLVSQRSMCAGNTDFYSFVDCGGNLRSGASFGRGSSRRGSRLSMAPWRGLLAFLGLCYVGHVSCYLPVGPTEHGLVKSHPRRRASSTSFVVMKGAKELEGWVSSRFRDVKDKARVEGVYGDRPEAAV